jgi:hypothetical protein
LGQKMSLFQANSLLCSSKQACGLCFRQPSRSCFPLIDCHKSCLQFKKVRRFVLQKLLFFYKRQALRRWSATFGRQTCQLQDVPGDSVSFLKSFGCFCSKRLRESLQRAASSAQNGAKGPVLAEDVVRRSDSNSCDSYPQRDPIFDRISLCSLRGASLGPPPSTRGSATLSARAYRFIPPSVSWTNHS